MSTKKYRYLRHNILDYCFREKNFTFDDLLDYLNKKLELEIDSEACIEKRTLREDIKRFRKKHEGFYAPLPEKSRVYKYEDSDFSIAQRPLLNDEEYLLNAAKKLLERYDLHPTKYKMLQEALIHFQEEMDEEKNSINDDKKILYHDFNEDYKGLEHLKTFYLAIKNKKVLRITDYTYKNKDKERSYNFHPQILKQYNRRWFVFGYNTSYNKMEWDGKINEHINPQEWSIPLDDRIVNIERLEKNRYQETNTDWANFFRTMVGVIREGEPHRVELRFYNGREQWFKSKPFIHDSDICLEEEKSNHVFFHSIINRELVQQILSYGKDVEVLEPEILKNKIKEHVTKMNEHYK